MDNDFANARYAPLMTGLKGLQITARTRFHTLSVGYNFSSIPVCRGRPPRGIEEEVYDNINQVYDLS